MKILPVIGLCVSCQMLFAAGADRPEVISGAKTMDVSIQNTPFEVPAVESASVQAPQAASVPESTRAGKDMFAADNKSADVGLEKLFASSEKTNSDVAAENLFRSGKKSDAGECADNLFRSGSQLTTAVDKLNAAGDAALFTPAAGKTDSGADGKVFASPATPQNTAMEAPSRQFFAPGVAPGKTVQTAPFTRSASGKPARPCTPEEYKSLELCMQRNALELYYMDFAAMLQNNSGNEDRELHRTDMPPVQISRVDRSLQQFGLLTATGTLDPKQIPPKLRRNDLDFDAPITRMVCIAMRNSTAARAKLVRQAELKGFRMMLQRCSGKLDLSTRKGRSGALHVLAALNFERCSFYENPNGREMQMKARMSVQSGSLPAEWRNRLGTEVLKPLEFIEKITLE